MQILNSHIKSQKSQVANYFYSVRKWENTYIRHFRLPLLIGRSDRCDWSCNSALLVSNYLSVQSVEMFCL